MKTFVVVEIDHKKPLPDDITDQIANRAYMLIHSRDPALVISARIESEVKEEQQ